MLLFGLLLIIFSLNVIQSELYESKPGELSEASPNVQENLVSLDDLDNSNIKNNIIKRDVSSGDEQEDSAGKSMRAQSVKRRHSPSHFSRARRLLQLGGQRRSGRRGISGRGRRRVQPGRRGSGRFPGSLSRSRSKLSGRGRRARQGSRGRSRGRRNQSPAGDMALEEEVAEEDVAEEESVPYPYYYDYYDYYYC